MDKQDIIAQVTIVMMELTVSRKGSTRVRIDLRNRLLSWRESNRWNRNFTRSINAKERQLIYDGMRDCRLVDWKSSYGEAGSQDGPEFDTAWHLALYTDDIEPIYSFNGQDAFPPEFEQWIAVISTVCRQIFQVND